MDAVRAKGYRFQNEVMPFDLYKKIVDDFAGRCKSFGVSCGYEPLINKEFDRYLAYARERGLPDIHFYTNGTLLTPDMAERIVAAEPERIVFSLEGTNEESFQDIRRGATLEKFLAAIDMIHAGKERRGLQKPALRLNWVMMPRNIAELPALATLARDHHCAEIYFIPHIRWEAADLQEDSLVEHDLASARASLIAFKKQCAEYGITVFDELFEDAMPHDPPPAADGNGGVKGLLRKFLGAGTPEPTFEPYCRQPWEMMIVTSSGTIMPCSGTLLDRVYGDFRTQTLQEMWESDTFRALRDGLVGKAEPCDHCTKCPHFRLNRKDQDFHRIRPLDVELLRQVIPSIVPKRAVATKQ